MIYAIDFDGTVVTHEFPKIGQPVPHALEVMNRLQDDGHQIILWTMRSGKTLTEAVEYLKGAGIKLWGINENPDQDWTTSPKAYANRYIDDAALGCPLILPSEMYLLDSRPYVDWKTLFPQYFS